MFGEFREKNTETLRTLAVFSILLSVVSADNEAVTHASSGPKFAERVFTSAKSGKSIRAAVIDNNPEIKKVTIRYRAKGRDGKVKQITKQIPWASFIYTDQIWLRQEADQKVVAANLSTPQRSETIQNVIQRQGNLNPPLAVRGDANINVDINRRSDAAVPKFDRNSFRRSMSYDIDQQQKNAGTRMENRIATKMEEMDDYIAVPRSRFSEQASRPWTFRSTGERIDAKLQYCDHFSEEIVLKFKEDGKQRVQTYNLNEFSDQDVLAALSYTLQQMRQQAIIAAKQRRSRQQANQRARQRSAAQRNAFQQQGQIFRRSRGG